MLNCSLGTAIRRLLVKEGHHSQPRKNYVFIKVVDLRKLDLRQNPEK